MGYCSIEYVKKLDKDGILTGIPDTDIEEVITISSAQIDVKTEKTFVDPIPSVIQRATAILTLFLFETKSTERNDKKIIEGGGSKMEYFQQYEYDYPIPKQVLWLLEGYMPKKTMWITRM